MCKGPALIAFMQHQKWEKIAILSSTESLWFETRQGLGKQLEATSMKVLKPAAFEPGNMKEAMLSEVSVIHLSLLVVAPPFL